MFMCLIKRVDPFINLRSINPFDIFTTRLQVNLIIGLNGHLCVTKHQVSEVRITIKHTNPTQFTLLVLPW
ncbi:hypothetical protein Hanom_Chr11g00991021 [Helianthus anomalus]